MSVLAFSSLMSSPSSASVSTTNSWSTALSPTPSGKICDCTPRFEEDARRISELNAEIINLRKCATRRSDIVMKAKFNIYKDVKRTFAVTFGVFATGPNCYQHRSFTVKCMCLAEMNEDGAFVPVLQVDALDAASFEESQELTLARFKGDDRDCFPTTAKYGNTLLNGNLFLINATPIGPAPEEPCPIIRRFTTVGPNTTPAAAINDFFPTKLDEEDTDPQNSVVLRRRQRLPLAAEDLLAQDATRQLFTKVTCLSQDTA